MKYIKQTNILMVPLFLIAGMILGTGFVVIENKVNQDDHPCVQLTMIHNDRILFKVHAAGCVSEGGGASFNDTSDPDSVQDTFSVRVDKIFRTGDEFSDYAREYWNDYGDAACDAAMCSDIGVKK